MDLSADLARSGAAQYFRVSLAASCLVTFVGLFAASVGAPPTASAQAFRGLGDLPGGVNDSRALAVSDNGVVTGRSDGSDGQEMFIWTEGEGMVGLGDLTGTNFGSAGYGISADGATIAGSGTVTSPFAARWTAADGLQNLGDFPSGEETSVAFGISADGQVIVGIGEPRDGPSAFLWTETGGLRALGDLPGGPIYSGAHAASADGSVVVGSSTSGTANSREAFRWENSVMQGLGFLSQGIASEAYGVSSDGAVIVGYSTVQFGAATTNVAFRWTAVGGMESLGTLGSLPVSVALDVSGDGEVVVGLSLEGSQDTAFIWTAAAGMRSIADVLTSDYGEDLGGWTLTDAASISRTGRYVVGTGQNPSGDVEAWRVDLAASTDIASEAGSAPTPSATLGAAYPNPFSSATTVTVELPDAAPCRVAVFDILGREVVVLGDGLLAAGQTRLSLDGTHLPPGTYFVNVRTPDGVSTTQTVVRQPGWTRGQR